MTHTVSRQLPCMNCSSKGYEGSPVVCATPPNTAEHTTKASIGATVLTTALGGTE